MKREPGVATSVRIPAEVKELLDDAAQKANQSINDYVVRAVQLRLDGACPLCAGDRGGADYWDRRLSEWLEEQAPRSGAMSQPVVIGADDPRLGRVVYVGTFRREWARGAQITLSISQEGRAINVPIARRYVTHWGPPELHRQLKDVGYVDFPPIIKR